MISTTITNKKISLYQKLEKYHRHFLEFNSDFKKTAFEIKDAMKFDSFLSKSTDNYNLLVIKQNPNQLESKVRRIFGLSNLMVFIVDCLGVSSGELLTNPIDNLSCQKVTTRFDYNLKAI